MRVCFLSLLLLAGCGSGVRTVAVAVAPAVPTCVTFIGDSITEQWPMANFTRFDRGCYIDHGRGGTTVPQILDGIDNHNLPYDASVDPAKSRIAVIGGDAINSFNAGLTLQQVEAAYDAILVKLRGLGVQPVLCTLLPTASTGFNAQTVLLNAYLRGKTSEGIPIVDVSIPPLVQPDGTSNPEYFIDRIHLKPSSYAVFTGPVESAIHAAADEL